MRSGGPGRQECLAALRSWVAPLKEPWPLSRANGGCTVLWQRHTNSGGHPKPWSRCGSSCLFHATCSWRLACRSRFEHASASFVVGSGAQSDLSAYDFSKNRAVQQAIDEDWAGLLIYCQRKRYVLFPGLVHRTSAESAQRAWTVYA